MKTFFIFFFVIICFMLLLSGGEVKTTASEAKPFIINLSDLQIVQAELVEEEGRAILICEDHPETIVMNNLVIEVDNINKKINISVKNTAEIPVFYNIHINGEDMLDGYSVKLPKNFALVEEYDVTDKCVLLQINETLPAAEKQYFTLAY